MLPEEPGLSTEQLTCLYKECIEMAKHCNDISTMVNSCMQFVEHSNSLGRHADSLRRLKEILPLAEAIPFYELMVHGCLSVTFKELNEFDNVVLHAKKWIEIAQSVGDKENEMYGHHAMGNALSFLARYDDAIDYGKKCLEIAQKIDSADGEMNAYNLIMDAYENMEKYDDTILYAHKLLDCALKNNNQEAMMDAYVRLGNAFSSLARYDDAIDCGKKWLKTAQEIDSPEGMMDAYNRIIVAYGNMQKYDEVILYALKLLDCAMKNNDQKAMMNAYFNLEQAHFVLKHYQDATDFGQKCIKTAREIEDISQDHKKAQMHGHFVLAQAHMELLQLNEVSQNIDAGMAIATELGDKEAEEHFKEIRSSVYCTVGLRDKCDAPSVKELLEVPTCSEDELLQDRDQAVKTGDKKKKHRAFMRLYNFYLSKKEYKKTINCLEQLKEMDINCSLNLFCFTEIGKLYQVMGQNDMALHSFKEGKPTAKSCPNNDGQLSQFYHGFGQLLYSLNRELNLAEHYLRKAIRCFEAIFSTLGSLDEFKISIFDEYIDSYKMLAILLIIGEQNEEALLVLDRCRARALKDLMISNFKMEQEESNDEHLEYRDVLSLVSRNDFSIAFYSLCWTGILRFFIGGERNLHFSKCLIHSLQIDVDRLFDEMGVREVVDCENRSLDKEEDIQKERKRSQEEYEGLNQPTALLLNLDSNTGESNENSAEAKESTLEDLFDILECDRILSSKQDEVVIIPEGPLYKVPFPALRDRRTGKYLSETKRIRLAPSLATLKHFEDFPTDQTSDAKPLVIGNPLVGRVMMDGEEVDIERLPGAEAEAIKIACKLGVRPLIGEAATKQAVLEKLQQAVSVVHIAAHGSLTRGTIALAPPEVRATEVIPDEEDYILTMADVREAQVRAQLVVLSCCNSGRGEIRAEGVVSMCRAFLASGARAVVASLWAIDDDATLDFMNKFYTHLMDGMSASASLHQAMNEIRNSSGYSEPYYWAPFFLMGEDVTI